MILNEIFSDLIFFVVNLISFFIRPIDNLILSVLPDVSNLFTSVGYYLNLIASGLGFAISLLGIPTPVLSALIMYYTFKFTAPLLIYIIKLPLQWYNKLKP